MKLSAPFFIGPRLLPALKVDEATLSLDYVGTDHGRMVFQWIADLPEGEFSGADLTSGVQGCTTQEMFATFLTFLGACADGIRFEERKGRESENASMFPAPVAHWARDHQDEIDMLAIEIEETPNLIED